MQPRFMQAAPLQLGLASIFEREASREAVRIDNALYTIMLSDVCPKSW
jgi:hypothetical protein